MFPLLLFKLFLKYPLNPNSDHFKTRLKTYMFALAFC